MILRSRGGPVGGSVLAGLFVLALHYPSWWWAIPGGLLAIYYLAVLVMWWRTPVGRSPELQAELDRLSKENARIKKTRGR